MEEGRPATQGAGRHGSKPGPREAGSGPGPGEPGGGSRPRTDGNGPRKDRSTRTRTTTPPDHERPATGKKQGNFASRASCQPTTPGSKTARSGKNGPQTAQGTPGRPNPPPTPERTPSGKEKAVYLRTAAAPAATARKNFDIMKTAIGFFCKYRRNPGPARRRKSDRPREGRKR